MLHYQRRVTLPAGDNQMFFSTLILILAAACAASLGGADAALAATSNEANELQQLANGNEKLQLLNLRQTNDNHSNRQHLQVIANDLSEQPEAANSLSDSSRTGNRQQQIQAQQQPKLISQSNVINGNHATYVEPPADFKPIIYDYDKQRQQQVQQQQPLSKSPFSSEPSSQPIESLELFNQLSSQQQATAASLAQQQQQQQHQLPHQQVPAGVDPLMISSHDHSSDIERQMFAIGGENYQQKQQISGSNELHKSDKDADASTMMFKPSIGRWSDWHDMSVEPDLASSDSVARLQTVKHYAMPGAPYRTRYKSRPLPNYVITGTKTHRSSPLQPRQPEEEAEQQVQRAQAKTLTTPLGRDIGRIGASVANQAAASKQPPASQLEPLPTVSKSGQHQHWSVPSTTASNSNQVNGNKLTLNTAVNGNTKQPIKMQQQQQNELNQLQASTGQQLPVGSTSFVAKTSSISAIAVSPLAEQQLQQKQRSKPRLQRRLKRRRKSKTNAEVRIQQLVAASQQQQELAAGKQVTPLMTNQAQTAEHLKAAQLGHQQAVESARQQQTPTERLPAVGKRAPNFVVKRYGSPALATQVKSGGAQPREQKKRRIKSQLPVGLSSWFLGGVRDLDGRHWQLPAEVVSRLAVNDVDLVGGQSAPKVEPPAAGSVVMLRPERPEREGASVEQTGGFPAPADSNQVPISKVIPRK